MQHTHKYLIFLILFGLFSSQLVRAADLASDSEQLFNLAELVFPQSFTPTRNTNHASPAWPYYRGPYNRNVYIGVNSDGFVYVLGGDFGNVPVNAGTIQEALSLLNSNIGTQITPFGPGARSGISTTSERLNTPEKTITAVNNINGLEQISGDWLARDWGTYYFDNGLLVEKIIKFNLDGTYQSESINKEINQANGKWLLVASSEDGSMNLTLWNSAGALAGNYPIEREGTNSFRLINQSSRPDVRSILYTNSADVARFPGMFFLGDFEYINYGGASNRYLFQYHFNNNGTVRRLIYGDFSLERKLQSNTMGTWLIDPDGSQFQVTFANQTERFTIRNATSSTVSMYTSTTEYQYWKRFEESILPDVDPYVGEFQGNNTQDYLSIKKIGNNYLVDVIEGHLSGKAYYQVPGVVLNNGQLSISVPEQYNGETEIIIQAGYNRLIVKEFPGVFFSPINDSYYLEKVSKNPLMNDPVNIFGQWRNTLPVGKGGYYIFLDDGHYYHYSISFEYGTYHLNGNSILMTPSCGNSYQRDFEIVDHRIKLDNISYNPVPGIRDLRHIGTQLENTLFKSQLDRFLETNGAKLKPHPLFAGVFVFAEETNFSAGDVAMTFMPDGTGHQFSGAILNIYEGWYLERFIGTRFDSFLFDIDYYVTVDGDKESVVYYNNGGWISDYRGVVNFGSFQGDPNSAKELKLYHGRSAVCYTITENHEGIVLPIKN